MWRSPSLVRNFTMWKVSDETTLKDHRHILFENGGMNLRPSQGEVGWVSTELNEELLLESLGHFPGIGVSGTGRR